MHKSKDQLYELVKDIKTIKEFKLEVEEFKKESDDLIDDDTAALFIVDKNPFKNALLKEEDWLSPWSYAC